MSNEKLYSADEVCKELKITEGTLSNWYRYQTKELNEGIISEPYLPSFIKLANTKGQPRRWNAEGLKALKVFQKNIVTGRNGVYGKYSNPSHMQTKKYKKSLTTN